MIAQILANRGIKPIDCELPYLSQQVIGILAHNPSDTLHVWSVKLRSGELAIIIPDAADEAGLIIEEQGAMWYVDQYGTRARMDDSRIYELMDDPVRIVR